MLDWLWALFRAVGQLFAPADSATGRSEAVTVLSNADRLEVWAKLMRELSDSRSLVTINKVDLRAVIDAADAWADANAAAYNSALPLPGRTALTARQKAWILMGVILKRWEATP